MEPSYGSVQCCLEKSCLIIFFFLFHHLFILLSRTPFSRWSTRGPLPFGTSIDFRLKHDRTSPGPSLIFPMKMMDLIQTLVLFLSVVWWRWKNRQENDTSTGWGRGGGLLEVSCIDDVDCRCWSMLQLFWGSLFDWTNVIQQVFCYTWCVYASVCVHVCMSMCVWEGPSVFYQNKERGLTR